MSEQLLHKSSVMEFAEALNGHKGALDAWLECNNEAEVRAHIKALVTLAQPAEGGEVVGFVVREPQAGFADRLIGILKKPLPVGANLYTTQPASQEQAAAALMPCGTAVHNVYEAYEAGKKASQEQAEPTFVPNTFKLPGESDDAWLDRITGATPAEQAQQPTRGEFVNNHIERTVGTIRSMVAESDERGADVVAEHVRKAMVHVVKLAQQPEPDMRHPKIQGLMGAKARCECELGLIEDILDADDPSDVSTGLIEYWGPLHDRIASLAKKARALPNGLTEAETDQSASVMGLTTQAQAQELPDEREAFEYEMRKRCDWSHSQFNRSPFQHDDYEEQASQDAWEAWQARAALAAKQIPSDTQIDAIFKEVLIHETCDNDFRESVRKILASK